MRQFSGAIVLAASLVGAAAPAVAANWSVFSETPLSRMSKEDAESYRKTILDTLERGEDGKAVSWQGKANGTSSKMTPAKQYAEGELTCREIRLETRAGGLTASGPYRFCKTASGGWEFNLGARKRSSSATTK
jgi:surface antigen